MPLDPPSVARDPATRAALEAAYAAKGADYAPRTRHLDAGGRAKYVNRLILDSSPYLLQHAHNPVDWRSWSEETLAEAARLDRPVFVSVGYATCHWCHVMEEESFDDEEVAAFLNAQFIAVKIDREVRPDLDQVFITATQLQQGHAGWPNSVFLTPDGRPFHTGTYFPKPQFLQLLAAIAGAWSDQRRSQIEGVAGELSAALARFAPQPSGAPGGSGGLDQTLDEAVMDRAATAILSTANESEGGFSQSQQFPQEVFLTFLMDHWRRGGPQAARDAALRTLDAIAAGGIHDHVGGGFHRYTVDPNWRTPHFEKMLYNQGQLARAFVEGWEMTGRPAYRRAAERAFAYVLRDLRDAAGAFYAAEDADSRDATGALEEGAFYVWPPAEARAALGADADAAIRRLGLDRPATIEAGPVAHLDPGAAVDFALLDPLLERLRLARDARARPLRDDKVIAGWNGLMIRALADGAAAFDRPDLAEAAARAGEALWARLWTGERLHRLWAGGRAEGAAMLEDYAWLGLGFLALADATRAPVWTERAETLANAALTRFEGAHGRLRMAEADGPVGPVYDSADGATPAGESAAAELFARLAQRRPDPAWRQAAETLLTALGQALAAQPIIRPDALVAARILAAGESTHRRVLAGGTLGVRLAPGGSRLDLDIAQGWHLNAHAPGPDWLVGAALAGAATDWPEGAPLETAFAGEPVRVYEGRLNLPLDPGADSLRLTAQLCSDRLCLDPVEAIFRLR